MSACRDELARVQIEVEHKVRLATMQLSARLASVEAGACGQTQRAQRLENELRSAQAELDEMSASRPQQGFEAEIIVETIRDEKVDAETKLSWLRHELAGQASCCEAEGSEVMQSTTSLEKLLKES